MKQEELQEILDAHKKWINGKDGGARADLSGANLRGADLSGADLRRVYLDFACWPLWCGGLAVKVCKRIAVQLAYHFCKLDCDDPEYIAARNAILDFANQFHRVGECGKLEKNRHCKSPWRRQAIRDLKTSITLIIG